MNKHLYAGFSRLEITPEENGVPLGGYGATRHRLSARVLDPLYVSALCLGTAEKPECLFLVLDVLHIRNLTERFRRELSELTGIEGSRIFLGATHTHSAPDLDSDMEIIREYRENVLSGRLKSAALEAVADRKPARISYGRTEIGHPGARLNFIRHYLMTEKERKGDPAPDHLYPAGDNYGTEYASHPEQYVYAAHDGTPDHMLQIIRLERDEEADDILLLNFQAHASLTGGRDIQDVSSDWPGILMKRVEELLPGNKALFFQGAAGNLNPKTRMKEEGLPGLTYGRNGEFDHRGYANILAYHVRNAVREGLTASETDLLAFRTEQHTCQYDHSSDALVPAAEEAKRIHEEEGYSAKLSACLQRNGFRSPYQCGAILGKALNPRTGTVELNAIRLGDAALVTAPFELFSETGLEIKAGSPFPITLISGYTGEFQQYLPSKNACAICYERDISPFVPGTAEEVREALLSLLRGLKHTDGR